MARKVITTKKELLSPKVVVILGPTGSGKTALGVKLAAKFKGEIISADSRQVYRGMDIGTGKDLAEYQLGKKSIPYHLIDIINPNTKFNLARYQKLAVKAITDILHRGHLPLIVGGTGLYLQAVIDNYQLAAVKSDTKQRDALEQEGAPALFEKLTLLKPEFAAKINNSDKNNPEITKMIDTFFGIEKQIQKNKRDFIYSLKDILDQNQIAKLLVFEKKFKDEIRNFLFKQRRQGPL